jgi:iron complex outermembrane receptor protein
MHVLARARTAVGANPSRVDGFTVVNARPSFTLPRTGSRADLFVAIENLFDTTYAYRPGYPMPGASVQVGVSLRAGRR